MTQAIRTGRIEIDLLKAGDVQWISADIQHLDLDAQGNIQAIRMRDGKLYRRVDQVATEVVNMTDPVTGETFNISVAGIGMAIKMNFIKWMIQDNPGAAYNKTAGFVELP